MADDLPAGHIREFTEKSLANLEAIAIDLQQLHVWSDAWADDEGWQRATDDLKRRKLDQRVRHQREPLAACECGAKRSVPDWLTQCRSSTTSSTRAPEDELFPPCRTFDIAVIARVPFDEGSLTGTLTTRQPLARRRLPEHLFHAGQSRRDHRADRATHELVPAGMDLPALALRFILSEPTVSTVIPGMRKAPTSIATSRRATGRCFRPGPRSRSAHTAGIARTPFPDRLASVGRIKGLGWKGLRPEGKGREFRVL